MDPGDDDPPGPQVEALRAMFRDVEKSVATQVAAGERIDEKAYGIIRFNALLLGLVLTGVSLLARAGPGGAVPAWTVAALAGGGVFLVASMTLAFLEYRATRYFYGIRAGDIEDALAYRIGERRHLHDAIYTYAQGIRYNDRSFHANLKLFHAAIATLVPGLLMLVAAAATLMLSTVR